MAKIGFAEPWMAKLDATAGTYSDGFKCGAAVSGTITPNYQSSSLYADNQLKESASSMTDATVSLTVSDIPAQAVTVLFGHEVDEDGTVHYNVNDSANWVGLGAYEDNTVNGVKTFSAMVLPKVMFKETARNYTTKGDNVAFQTETIEGSAAFLNGDWKKTKDFTTAEAAIAWIKSELGIA